MPPRPARIGQRCQSHGSGSPPDSAKLYRARTLSEDSTSETLSPLSSRFSWPAPAAAAGTLAGVTLPDKADVDGQSLVLNGMGLRSKLFFKVYVGGLYLAQKEKSAQKVLGADVPRRMVLSFIYDVSKDQMCDAWNEGLEANTPNASAEVKKNFATLCGWMDGVGKGQQARPHLRPRRRHPRRGQRQGQGHAPRQGHRRRHPRHLDRSGPGPGEDFKKAVLGG